MTIDMQDNYGRTAAAHLPTIEVTGMKDPVVQIIDEKSKQVVYTLRIKGTSFKAKVFDKDGVYTVKVGDPDADQWQTKTGVKAGDGKILVKF